MSIMMRFEMVGVVRIVFPILATVRTLGRLGLRLGTTLLGKRLVDGLFLDTSCKIEINI